MGIRKILKGLMGRGASAGTEDATKMEMISCEEALEGLYEYLDGELVGAAHDRVKAHFDICARCYPKLRLEESFRLAVQRAARGQTAPPDLRRKLLAALEEAEAGDGDPDGDPGVGS